MEARKVWGFAQNSNGPKGLVLPTQEKNLCIEPDKARLTRLDSLHEDAQL